MIGRRHAPKGPFSLINDLGSSLVNNSVALWLLSMLAVLAFVLVIAQIALAKPEASATSG
jgi:hypothetical protein